MINTNPVDELAQGLTQRLQIYNQIESHDPAELLRSIIQLNRSLKDHLGNLRTEKLSRVRELRRHIERNDFLHVPSSQASLSTPLSICFILSDHNQCILSTRMFSQFFSVQLPILKQKLVQLSLIFLDPSILIKVHPHQKTINVKNFQAIQNLMEEIQQNLKQAQTLLNFNCQVTAFPAANALQTANVLFSEGSQIFTIGRFEHTIWKIDDLISQFIKSLATLDNCFGITSNVLKSLKDEQETQLASWMTSTKQVVESNSMVIEVIEGIINWFNRPEFSFIENQCHLVVGTIDDALKELLDLTAQTNETNNQEESLDGSSQTNSNSSKPEELQGVNDSNEPAELIDHSSSLTKKIVSHVKLATPILKLSRLIINHFFPPINGDPNKKGDSLRSLLKELDQSPQSIQYCHYAQFCHTFTDLIKTLSSFTDDLVDCIGSQEPSNFGMVEGIEDEESEIYENNLEFIIQSLADCSNNIFTHCDNFFRYLNRNPHQDLVGLINQETKWVEVWLQQFQFATETFLTSI
ncbi:hypothetical protein O181_003280 [Austropuccinia psidii MF-1]|uniref:Uncharacterized protein n=1 Tax=Austropuccinia psidii MF-1 TaxID=1389203 RepID=A0A9Q3BE46_9BASI|nr:hypothetical protein [Austropuccinia psidii MF-1]